MADLRANEKEDLEFAFGIYETDKNKLDSIFLGKVMRAFNLNPSLDTLTKDYGVGKKAARNKVVHVDGLWGAENVSDLTESVSLIRDPHALGAYFGHSIYSRKLLSQGEKFFNLDEVYEIASQCKKQKKDQGCYEDFIECLKLYDKDENGKMLVGELSHSLLSLGEKLTDAEVDELFTDCLPEEDDEGQIDYDPFLRAMCEKPPK